MKKIHLEHFRAFKTTVTIDDFENKNLMLCGENGAGKTSLFEGIKLSAYYQRLKNESVKEPFGSPGYHNAVESWIARRYRNSIQNNDVVVEIDDIDYINYAGIANEGIYMIGTYDIKPSEQLYLKDILQRVYFPISDVNTFLTENLTSKLLSNVNRVLKDIFAEEIKLQIDPLHRETFQVTIHDTLRNIIECDNLTAFFNEAKLHLVLLTILMEVAKLHSEGIQRNSIIIMDDIVSSLDSGNRTFLLNYIINDYAQFQKILFTHNVSFFNLTMHLLRKHYIDHNSKWSFKTMYEYDCDCYVYEYKTDDLETKQLLSDIKKNNGADDTMVQALGTKLRKRFEQLTVELSRIFSFGDLATSELILEKLATKNSTLYMKINPNGGLLSFESLLKEIASVVNSPNPDHEDVRNKIKNIFHQYEDHDNQKKLRDTIARLRIFQKVVMHPMSHGIGNVTFTIKELKVAAGLIEQLQKTVDVTIKSHRGNNVNDAS